MSNKHREEINNRFDDIVSRLDATQRAEASIRQMLGLIMQERKDLRYRQREGRAGIGYHD